MTAVDRLSHVFPGSHAHVAEWPAKHWHSAIGDPKSSQALCVSVWGTIAAHRNRTAIIAEVFAAAGLDVGVPAAPNVTCEAGADGGLAHLLNETGGNATPTCVDALIEWPKGTVCVESKLTEASFGGCSQVLQRTDRPPGAPGTTIALGKACSGTHEPGSDLKTGSRAPCRLTTWDGSRAPRLYWSVAWELFRPDVLVPDGRTCPFAGPSFQLMRNLALARARAAPRSKRPSREQPPVVEHRQWGLLVAHAESHPNARRHRDELDAFCELLLDDVRPRVAMVAYEQVLPILAAHGLQDLALDIERRIALALA